MAILQVRDLPDEVLAKLRERAEAEGTSVSGYVRDLLTRDTAKPTVSEVLARVAKRPPVDLRSEDILEAIHEGRR